VRQLLTTATRFCRLYRPGDVWRRDHVVPQRRINQSQPYLVRWTLMRQRSPVTGLSPSPSPSYHHDGCLVCKSCPFLGVPRHCGPSNKRLGMGKGGKTNALPNKEFQRSRSWHAANAQRREQKIKMYWRQRSISGDGETRYIEIWRDEARTLSCVWCTWFQRSNGDGQVK